MCLLLYNTHYSKYFSSKLRPSFHLTNSKPNSLQFSIWKTPPANILERERERENHVYCYNQFYKQGKQFFFRSKKFTHNRNLHKALLQGKLQSFKVGKEILEKKKKTLLKKCGAKVDLWYTVEERYTCLIGHSKFLRWLL